MNLVKELRQRAGMQQKEVALAVGVSRPTVSEWEHQKKDPSGERLKKLAELFKVDPGLILGYQIGETEAVKDVDGTGAIRIPVYGTIPAGVPMDAIEDVLDYEDIPADWGRGGKEYMALKVSGHSMEPKYQDGDILILRRTESCENGQDCAVMVNGNDATFKRVKLTPGGLMLLPINPDYDPITFTAREVQELPVRILGVVVELRRKIN